MSYLAVKTLGCVGLNGYNSCPNTEFLRLQQVSTDSQKAKYAVPTVTRAMVNEVDVIPYIERSAQCKPLSQCGNGDSVTVTRLEAFQSSGQLTYKVKGVRQLEHCAQVDGCISGCATECLICGWSFQAAYVEALSLYHTYVAMTY